MARTAAAARTAAGARTAVSSRTAIAAYRFPVTLLDLGVTHLYDWRTGFIGTNNSRPVNLAGFLRLTYLGGSALSSVYTASEYSADLELTNTDYFQSSSIKLSSSAISNITVFAWFKSETLTNASSLVAQWRAAAGLRGFELRAQNTANSNKMTAFLSTDGTAVTQYNSTTGVFTDTNWHFGAWSYAGGTTTMLMNGDGSALSSTLIAGSAPATILNPQQAVTVGAILNVGGSPINVADGKIGLCGLAVGTAMGASGLAELYKLTNSIGHYV